MASRALLLVAFVVLSVTQLAEAGYYGGYGGFGGGGGRTVVRRTSRTVVRRGGGGYYHGRRLLQEDEDASPKAMTMLDIIESRPDLSMFVDAIQDMPKIKEALADPKRDDTFFAPTNEALESLSKWAGFQDTKKGLAEVFGDKEVKALIIAYHAVPKQSYTSGELVDMDQQFLQSALGNVLDSEAPLLVDEYNGDVFIKGKGSEAKVIVPDIGASNGVIHLIDHVLLPLDGDGELDAAQKERVERAIQKMEAMEAAAPSEAPAMAPSMAEPVTEPEDEDEE